MAAADSALILFLTKSVSNASFTFPYLLLRWYRYADMVGIQYSLNLYCGSVGRASDLRSFEAYKLVVFPMIMVIFLHCIVLSALEDPQ